MQAVRFAAAFNTSKIALRRRHALFSGHPPPHTHKPTHPTPQIVQAAALCRGIVDFIESRLGAGAAARVPVLIGGDFNSLPAKWASDAFDRVGAL